MRLPDDTLRFSLARAWAGEDKTKFLASCNGEWFSSPAMTRGSAFHEAMARKFYPAYDDGSLAAVSPEVRAEVLELASKTSLPSPLRRVTSVETTWRYPLLAQDYGRVWLQGTFDALALDISGKGLWILDWKTGKSSSRQNQVQLQWYIWLARRCGLNVIGALLAYVEQDKLVDITLSDAEEEVVGQHIYGTLAEILAYQADTEPPAESPQEPTEVTLAVVGVSFAPGYPKNLSGLSTGAKITLTCDPDNPVDENAVSVRAEGVHIGYLPAKIAARYKGPWEGKVAEVLESPETGTTAGVRISVRGMELSG